MLIARAPLRITLGGGGTDLPTYYRRFGSVVLAAAINRYVYVAISRTLTGDYVLRHAELERVHEIAEIRHPIIREALSIHPIGPSVEIVSLADVPSGTGLGSSGTFTVALLRALHRFRGERVSRPALAEAACQIEIDRLNRPVGKQDAYIAAFGGLTCFEFQPDGKVCVASLAVSDRTTRDLEEHLVLFFTGRVRDASLALAHQRASSEIGEATMMRNLHEVARLALAARHALEVGDTQKFAAVLHEQWLLKCARGAAVSTAEIDGWYKMALAHGAVGGKLVGAGGGGFLMFYADDPDALRAAMTAEGLVELPFAFDREGVTVKVE